MTTTPPPPEPTDDEIRVLSVGDCQERWLAYWARHGHEGTASYDQKKEAFARAYWGKDNLFLATINGETQ